MSQQKNDRQGVDLEFLTGLAELLGKADINEIEIKDEGLKIRVSRGFAPVAAPASSIATSPAMAPSTPSTPMESPPTASTSSASAPAKDASNAVPSPMVGTAYLASAPGAEPYIRVGDKVSKGQTILIIEAMKTMNQIPSPAEGVVAAICVEDGQPVEFGEALIKLD